ncbi:amino acid adenylation domain-containing protein [Inhella sp.]|uniref:amino acid adenylation domain-containing protein n=1 Tax=Inhella sp. TaxID=1921806 RepID=UPI0035B15B41
MHPLLPQLFERHAAQCPQAPALVDQGECWSYAELNRRADHLAAALAARGIGAGDRVVLAYERSAQALAALLGILKSGAAYVPVDPAHPAEWQAQIVADCEPAAVLGALRSPHSATLDDAWWLAQGPAAWVPDRALAAEDLMYLIYTSGSTGQPKGVRVSHANVARLFPSLAGHMPFGAQDRWTLCHSLSFGFSVWEVWGAWAHGGCLVLVPPALSQSPQRLLDLLAAERVTVLSQTPTAFRQLARGLGPQTPALPDLRWVAFSGEALEPHTLAPWLAHFGAERPRLANLYALTETSGEVAFHRVTDADLAPGRGACIGQALPDVRLRLVDEQGADVAPGELGELVVGGPSVALGYWRRPELEAQRFGWHDGQREYRTGDLARQGPDGALRFEGRADRQVKLRGYRVELGAVEAALASHPALRDAVVDAEPQGTGGRCLVAYVQPIEGGALPAGLAAFVAERLPHYAVPERWVAIDHLPMTPNGKLDWAALRAQAGAPADPPPAHVQPGAGLQQAVAALWCRVLQRAEVTPDDDFFDLGGYSLLALELTLALEQELGLQVTMTDLFEAPTLAALCALLERRQSLGQDPEAQAAEAGMDGVYMRQAIAKAREAMLVGQPPYAACIVGPDGAVLAVAHNAIWQNQDATAHAEVEAIRAACRNLGASELKDCVLYSTAEPCSMCLSASVWAGLQRIVYAIDMQDEPRFGLAEPTVPCRTLLQMLGKPVPVQGGVMRAEMHALLEDWLRLQSVRP